VILNNGTENSSFCLDMENILRNIDLSIDLNQPKSLIYLRIFSLHFIVSKMFSSRLINGLVMKDICLHRITGFSKA
jgi:hypothetical protein